MDSYGNINLDTAIDFMRLDPPNVAKYTICGTRLLDVDDACEKSYEMLKCFIEIAEGRSINE